ncbi:unnamed protein product [Acanthoscelides obtectus]|uniref:Uncharacterized protein n=1 Tax=Acanthoscelides obtectus TaxID=200917 RepID=A0A9P0KIQ9_ACAOB|nr:unnamed protein product [Acanthoscelides obtectus]CAK1624764.1 hypothetical protein AOBTE_LOCUS2748 [Acanthoscelides obtectus]
MSFYYGILKRLKIKKVYSDGKETDYYNITKLISTSPISIYALRTLWSLKTLTGNRDV